MNTADREMVADIRTWYQRECADTATVTSAADALENVGALLEMLARQETPASQPAPEQVTEEELREIERRVPESVGANEWYAEHGPALVAEVRARQEEDAAIRAALDTAACKPASSLLGRIKALIARAEDAEAGDATSEEQTSDLWHAIEALADDVDDTTWQQHVDTVAGHGTSTDPLEELRYERVEIARALEEAGIARVEEESLLEQVQRMTVRACAERMTGERLEAERNEQRARAEKAEEKIGALAGEVAAGLERERVMRAQLAIVATDTGGVWRWQGDGHDDPASLACPVVMSADTLRAMLTRAETAEAERDGQAWVAEKRMQELRDRVAVAEADLAALRAHVAALSVCYAPEPPPGPRPAADARDGAAVRGDGVLRGMSAAGEGGVKERAMAKKALKAKKTRTIDVKPLDVFGYYDQDVFGYYDQRIVVGIAGPKARVLNSDTGRVTSVSIASLQRSAPRCSQKDADATLRQVVRDMPKLALKWGLVAA